VASGLNNKKLTEKRDQAEDQGDRDARACFNAHAPKQSFFAGLTKEAQSLVDRLALSSKDYINDYPERLAEFQKDQAARRKEAKEVDFSEEKMEDVEKSYPFLHKDLEDFEGPKDTAAHIHIAESRGKINLLFVNYYGPLACGTGGCNETVYVDEGAGYKPAFNALTQDNDPVYVTRTGGEVFLYFGPPNIISQQANGVPVELILKDGQFVENKPPPREPDSSAPPSSASVPSIPVRWYEGMDAPGNDFGPWLFSVANAEDRIRLCAQDSGCVGVTYNIGRSVCIRKSRIRSLNYTRDAATTGVLTDRTPAPDAFAGPTPHVRTQAGAQSLGCEVVGSIRSEQGTAPAVMVFEDSLDQPISIYWINYNGDRIIYKDLQPGGSFSVNTYFTHPWLITRQDGACLDVFVPSQVAQTIAITGTPPAALPGTPEAGAKPADSMPSGPAAQAILQWFTTDRSLGCSDSACTLIDSSASFEVYYGDLSGGGPKADALAFVYYGPYLIDGGNAVALAAAYFHRDGGSYRFVKTFTDSFGSRDITGTDVRFLRVQFLPGKASITAAGLGGNGPRLADYTVTLNPTSPTSPAPHVRHYENVDAPGNNRGNWIRGVSSADCESISIADGGCAGYTYNRSRATCIPKSIVVRLMGSSEPAVTGVVEGR
jgi:hypothetical protein